MKILFISDNFPPEVNAPANRTVDHCRAWVRQGAEVTVITCAPNFPTGRVYAGYRNRLYQREEIDGIDVIRVWSYMASNSGFLLRILDYLSFSFTAFLAGLREHADVIVATSPQFFTTLTGCALSLLKRKPWVFELRDIWPESIVAVGAMRRGAAIRLLEKLERLLYHRSDLIVPVTYAFSRYLQQLGIEAHKIEVVPNGVDSDVYFPMGPDAGLKSELQLDGRFVISYIGTHGMAHGLDFVVEAIARIDCEEFAWLFIGDGAERARVVARAAELRLSNVHFIGGVPKDDVSRYLSVTNAALVNLKRSETFKSVIPSKIFEAAAMQIPILLGVDGQAREIIEQYDAGLCFEPENIEEMRAAVVRLAQDPALYSHLQAGCQRLAEAFDRKALANRMLRRLERLAER